MSRFLYFRYTERKPKIAFDLWKNYIESVNKKQIFDGLRSQKLKNSLEKITKRTLRNSSQRIVGGGNVVKGALQKVVNGLRSIPKKALRSWRKYADDVKNKKLLDGTRSQKLKNVLSNLPRRTVRESYERIKGVMFLTKTSFD